MQLNEIFHPTDWNKYLSCNDILSRTLQETKISTDDSNSKTTYAEKNDKKAGKLTEFFSLHTPKTKVSAKCEHNGTKRWNHVMAARKIASAIRLSNSESNGVLSLVTKKTKEALKIYVTTAGVTEHGKAFGHDLMPSNRHLIVKQVFEGKAFQGIIVNFMGMAESRIYNRKCRLMLEFLIEKEDG